MTILTRDFSKLIGIPYAEMNCWDAAREFYALCFGVALRHYCEIAPADRNDVRALIYSNIGEFEKVDGEYQFGDLLLLKIRGIECHIAIFVGNGKLFHSSKTTDSCIDSLEKWKHLITGCYRIKEAA